MSPVVYRDDESSAWGVMAIVMVVAVFALLIGYFAWWRPTQINAEPRERNIIVQPQAQPSSPTVVPVPVPGPAGPQGPAGASGASGPAGPAGPAGPSAPAQPEAPAQPSGPGSSTDSGSSSSSSSGD